MPGGPAPPPLSRCGLTLSCKLGLEGIVSKRKASAYRSARSPDWLKMIREWNECLQLPPDRAVERPRTAAADEEEQRAEADQQRIFEALCAPEESASRGREFHGHDHKDQHRGRGKAGEQSEHQQDAANKLGAADQRAPEYAWREADAIKERGVPGKAHAAERSKQLLHAMRNEDSAERDAQDGFGILVHCAVNVTERRNVMT
jgi:hypothetical protein